MSEIVIRRERPDGYDIDEEKALEYDAAFPPKVRLKLPGQPE